MTYSCNKNSTGADGRTNLAPFSFFQGITANPPTLMFVPVNKRGGTPKDTLRNLREVPEFVVNLVSFALAEKMNATAAELPHGESEFAAFGIAACPRNASAIRVSWRTAMDVPIRIRPPQTATVPEMIRVLPRLNA